jgi:hypothetical protein
MNENTELGHEFQKIGLTEIDFEALIIHHHLYILLRKQQSEACPDNWMNIRVHYGHGKTAAEAEDNAVQLAELSGTTTQDALEKLYKCEKFACPKDGGGCTFDWGLIGKPTPAVELGACTTKKHGINVTKRWESSQKVGYGCFCFKDA